MNLIPNCCSETHSRYSLFWNLLPLLFCFYSWCHLPIIQAPFSHLVITLIILIILGRMYLAIMVLLSLQTALFRSIPKHTSSFCKQLTRIHNFLVFVITTTVITSLLIIIMKILILTCYLKTHFFNNNLNQCYLNLFCNLHSSNLCLNS